MRVFCGVGARPNFVKIAPILRAFARAAADRPSLVVRLVHTGQHSCTSWTTPHSC